MLISDMNEETKMKYYFRLTLVLTAILLAVGVVFYVIVEKLSVIDAFYFSVVTLATVGYGDIVPKTDLGKIFTSFYIMGGIGVIAAFANLLVRNTAIKREAKLQRQQTKNQQKSKK